MTRKEKIAYLQSRLSDRDASVYLNASDETLNSLVFVERNKERKEKDNGIN